MKVYDEILSSIVKVEGKAITLAKYFSDNYFYFECWKLQHKDYHKGYYPSLECVYIMFLTEEHVVAWHPLDESDFHAMNKIVFALLTYHSSGLYTPAELHSLDYAN